MMCIYIYRYRYTCTHLLTCKPPWISTCLLQPRRGSDSPFRADRRPSWPFGPCGTSSNGWPSLRCGTGWNLLTWKTGNWRKSVGFFTSINGMLMEMQWKSPIICDMELIWINMSGYTWSWPQVVMSRPQWGQGYTGNHAQMAASFSHFQATSSEWL